MFGSVQSSFVAKYCPQRSEARKYTLHIYLRKTKRRKILRKKDNEDC